MSSWILALPLLTVAVGALGFGDRVGAAAIGLVLFCVFLLAMAVGPMTSLTRRVG